MRAWRAHRGGYGSGGSGMERAFGGVCSARAESGGGKQPGVAGCKKPLFHGAAAALRPCLWLSAGVAVCPGPDATSRVHMQRRVNGAVERGARFLRSRLGWTDCGIGENRRVLQHRRPCGSERRGPESNRTDRICNPGHNRFATAPKPGSSDKKRREAVASLAWKLEREKSLELSTSTLARLRSTN